MQTSHLLLRIFCPLFVAISLLLPFVSSAADSGKRIVSIKVSGNRYVDREAILANVESKTSELLSRKQISRDVRALFKTGFFEDVHVEGEPEKDGIRLIYIVKENPLIAEVSILGNDEIVDKKLKPKLELKPGRVFSAAALRRDRNEVRKAYLKKGYYQVGLKVEKTFRKDGRIDLTLHVDEGEITFIKRINFIGNSAFSDETLRGELASQESGFMSWFSSRDVFDRERFGADGQMLQQYYLNHGYLDINIESSQLSLTPDKESFYLNFSLFEGPQYSIDNINIQGDMVPSKEALREAIGFEKGDVYSVTELRRSIEAMEVVVGDEGFAFANVTPLFKRDVESQKVSITFDVEKGREIYIERIEISGNDKTTDKVIRRELRQHEGERYSATGVNRSKDRMQRLQLFKDVRVNLDKDVEGDRAGMNIEVEEDKTGSFSAGAGFSQIEGVFLTAKVEERNFLGRGYTTNLDGQIGGTSQNLSASLMDPYFLDSDVSASINAFKSETSLQDTISYDQESLGGGFGFGFSLAEFVSYSVGYQYSQSKITNVPAASSIAIRAQEGTQIIGEVRNALFWDTRNRSRAPTEGHVEQLGVNVAGLGGDSKFYEFTASTKSYFSLLDDYVFSPTLGFRSINALSGTEIPLFRRYSLGGIGSLRGFDSFGVSLRDPLTNDPVGGEKQLTGSLDLFFPLPYMETAGFRGVAFFDAGTVWGSIDTAVGASSINVSEKFSTSRIRTSVGLGIEWMSPVGPLSLAWSFPITKVTGDREKSFEFALGSSF
ncbi:MAG: outer membrane protein assembly factor BamA [Mariprofundaceae bacterium]